MPVQQLVQLHAWTVLHQRLGTHQEETVHRDHPPAVIGTWFVGLPGGYATVLNQELKRLENPGRFSWASGGLCNGLGLGNFQGGLLNDQGPDDLLNRRFGRKHFFSQRLAAPRNS